MIKGSMVALVTPMKSTGVIDWDALSLLVEWHVECGTAAIVAVGTSGESATLEVPEHCAVIKAVVEKVAGRIPVIAGTGANSTAEAITLTKAAKDAGADAALLVTPYYNKPTQEGLYLHHKAIAEAVDIPQILYNVPGRTACDMKPETVVRLAEIGNIIGIKEATGDLSRMDVLVNQTPDDFALYSGDDATAMDFILAGGHGDISVTANVAPKEMADMCALALAGDRIGAAAVNKPLLLLHERLFLESNPIPVKWALAEMGLIDYGIRLPLTVLDVKFHSSVREAFQQAGISLKQ
jgi:4-hydroxy-tetrahydrodipicolinate synthase